MVNYRAKITCQAGRLRATMTTSTFSFASKLFVRSKAKHVKQAVIHLRGQADRVLLKNVFVCSKASSAIATLPVSESHLPDLRGHFPSNPILPAVVVLEAMFQLAAVLQHNNSHNIHFNVIHNAKFRRIVTPADISLNLQVFLLDPRKVKGLAYVGPLHVQSPSCLAVEAEFGT